MQTSRAPLHILHIFSLSYLEILKHENILHRAAELLVSLPDDAIESAKSVQELNPVEIETPQHMLARCLITTREYQRAVSLENMYVLTLCLMVVFTATEKETLLLYYSVILVLSNPTVCSLRRCNNLTFFLIMN